MHDNLRAAGLAGILLLLTPSVTAQAPLPAPAIAGGDSAAALERALGTVSPDEIRSDLTFLASDELLGRDSPSPELKIAARFIRARLQRLGFQPGDRDGDYLYRYTWPQVGLNEAGTSAALHVGEDATPLVWGEDYFLARGAFGKRDGRGPIVWGGDLSNIDGLELEGRWVAARPDRRAPSRRRTQEIEQAGALGVVLLPFGEDIERQYAQLAQVNDWYKGTSLGRREDRATFPVLHLAPRAAAQLEALLGDAPAPGVVVPAEFEESCDWGQREPVTLENVCGYWPGSDPELKDEVILLSAHYDHVGHRPDGTIFNGADDNASGTSGLLAIAEALHAYGPMRRGVMLIWVSAEEKGLFGSQAWTEDPSMPEGTRPLCNINIDMIGRNDPRQLLITPTSEHPAYSLLTKTAEKHAAEEGFTKLGSADAYWRRSDHKNFKDNLDIPVAFLFTDVHEDYHKQTDTPDKIDYDKAARVVRLVVRMLYDLQVDRPEF